jgi:hypothetical protein
MLSIIRKSQWFKDAQTGKYKKAFLKNEKLAKSLEENVQIEESFDELQKEFEKELKTLEHNFDKKFQAQFEKRKEHITKNKETQENFWLNALSNHKLFKDFITNEDVPALKTLDDISYEKCDDINSFKIIFTFGENEFFSNLKLDKHYIVNDEHLITEIISTEIDWKKREFAFEKKDKKMTNKKTGETKLRTTEVQKDTFFNFFCNLRLPSEEEIKDFDFDDEKELGQHLDTEFEYGMEFVEEFIPHATDYFLGFKTESDEYPLYCEENAKMKK